MRVAIITLGTRGDVEPVLALGRGLQAAGHTVRLTSTQEFTATIEACGLESRPAASSFEAAMRHPTMRAAVDLGTSPAVLRLLKEITRIYGELAREMIVAGLESCRDVDLILGCTLGAFVGFSLAEKLGKPFIPCYLAPATPTREFPAFNISRPMPLSGTRLGGWLNYQSHFWAGQTLWRVWGPGINAARRGVLDLPPMGLERLYERRAPLLYGYSPHVVPRPADWGEHIHVTGYWFPGPQKAWHPPAELAAFLDGGPLPIYVGFGSMAGRQVEALTDLVVEALRRSGQRGILASGWGGMGAVTLPKTVFMADAVPHDWLFARIAAVVHHCGAGTTAAGLRAGVPTVPVPFGMDQPFWARQVAALGAGPAPIPRPALTAERLAQAITTAVTDPRIRQRAAELGVRIRAEDGVARAVEIIGSLEPSIRHKEF